MHHRSPLAVAAIATLFLAAGCGAAASDKEPADLGASGLTGEPIIIGMDEDSTGPSAPYSIVAGKAVRAAIQSINEQGGVLGRPLKLIVGNDESDPTKTPSTVEKLLQDGAVALIMQTGGNATNQVKPLIQESQVIALTPTSLNETTVTPPNADYLYSLANPISDYADLFCGLFKERNLTKVAYLTEQSAPMAGINDLLRPNLEKCVTVTTVVQADPTTNDLNAQVANVKKSDPDAVMVATLGGSYEILAQTALHDQMPDTPRFSLSSIGSQPDTWKTARSGALEGLVFAGVLDTNNERTTQVEATMRSDDKDFVMSGYAAQGWDAVHLIAKAISDAGTSTDKNRIHAAMNKITDYPAAFGQSRFSLSYSEDKHIGANGLCGFVLTEFGSDNAPQGPWAEYQPPCS